MELWLNAYLTSAKNLLGTRLCGPWSLSRSGGKKKEKFLCHRPVSNPIPLSPSLQPRWLRSDCVLEEVRVALPPPNSFVTKRVGDAKLLQTTLQRRGQTPTQATYFSQHFRTAHGFKKPSYRNGKVNVKAKF